MNETALSVRPATVGQLKEIGSLLLQAIPGDLTFEVASEVVGRKSDLIRHIQSFFPEANDMLRPVKQWERFYQKAFGLRVDLSSVPIPACREGFDRLIIIAEGITRNRVYDACAKHFKCWRYSDDLNTAIPKNDRDPKNGAYAIWVRDRVEADEEFQNLSADLLEDQKIKGITLLERMLLELKYFLETRKHLDLKNWTLCSGSRYSGGRVPSADRCGDSFFVYWRNRDDRDPCFRSREAVSL